MKLKTLAVASALLLAAGGAAGQAPPTDAQIAHIVVTANQIDIDAGKLAQTKGSNSDVKSFGTEMVNAHMGVNKQAQDLVAKLKVSPQDNPTSQNMKSDGAANLRRLQVMSGSGFDKAYIDREVTYHQQVIDAMDKTLIPNAKNQELKDLLTKSRPVFAGHLEHAKKIQGAMGG